MRKVVTAIYKGPASPDYKQGEFYPLLVQTNPSWIECKLRRWHRDHKVIITLPHYLPYLDQETFDGHWEPKYE